MSTQRTKKINWLTQHLPEGILVDAAWLRRQGYTANLLRKYVASGWLEQPAHRVYMRPRGPLVWQQVAISLQTLLRRDLVVGGRTALELHGYVHYLKSAATQVYLYGPKPPPTWLKNLRAGVQFIYRNDAILFRKQLASTAPHRLDLRLSDERTGKGGIAAMPWGQWNWPLMVSSPERAVLEFLSELPEHESFHNADMVMQGLTTLGPVRLQQLLADCRSVKAKRLLFFFAERHQHAWLKRIDRKAVDVGKGKRMLVKGGKLDAKHLITVPEDLDGVR
jgi:hypothetical protein